MEKFRDTKSPQRKPGKKLQDKTLIIPEPTLLLENGEPFLYVFVGDEAFPKCIYFVHIA